MIKYPTIDREFVPLRFDPSRNELFEDNENPETICREMTDSEKKVYRPFQLWRNWSFALIIIYIVFSAFLTIAIAIKYGDNPVPIIALGVCFVGESISAVLNSHIVDARDSWLKSRQQFGFEKEAKAFADYNRAVETQVQEWRNTHPLEEKIRKATESKNCIDIAEVVREITKGE